MAKKSSQFQDARKASENLAQLERSLAECIQRVENLERENDTNIKRMSALQAELDHLRSRVRS